ncbi:patatin-like phospholipase family protein [Actinocorallia longicatena]
MTISLAVVLGPGGPVGTAWMAGLARGLRDRGHDLGAADLLVGTSAGAIVAAALTTGRDLADLEELPESKVPSAGPERLGEVFALLGKEGLAPDAALREVGLLAAAAAPYPEELHLAQMGWTIGGDPAWPSTPLLIPTVNAATGRPVVWSREDGVPLRAAVAASTAMPTLSPPVTLRGEPHLDGALRAGANADLAAHAGFVVVLEPMGHAFPTPPLPEGAGLKIVPDDASVGAIGPDVGRRAAWTPSYRAGRAQAEAVAPLLSR